MGKASSRHVLCGMVQCTCILILCVVLMKIDFNSFFFIFVYIIMYFVSVYGINFNFLRKVSIWYVSPPTQTHVSTTYFLVLFLCVFSTASILYIICIEYLHTLSALCRVLPQTNFVPRAHEPSLP